MGKVGAYLLHDLFLGDELLLDLRGCLRRGRRRLRGEPDEEFERLYPAALRRLGARLRWRRGWHNHSGVVGREFIVVGLAVRLRTCAANAAALEPIARLACAGDHAGDPGAAGDAGADAERVVALRAVAHLERGERTRAETLHEERLHEHGLQRAVVLPEADLGPHA
jgi:hypothetical protein